MTNTKDAWGPHDTLTPEQWAEEYYLINADREGCAIPWKDLHPEAQAWWRAYAEHH